MSASIPWDRQTAICAWRRGTPLTICSPWRVEGMRTKLRSAIQQASQENARIVVAGGRINRDGNALSFSIAVQPVLSEGEELLLICFVDEPKHEREARSSRHAARRSAGRRA